MRSPGTEIIRWLYQHGSTRDEIFQHFQPTLTMDTIGQALAGEPRPQYSPIHWSVATLLRIREISGVPEPPGP